MRSSRGTEAAVSEVVGTVLLLGITIMAFAGVAVAVQARLETAPPAPNARFELLHEGPNMTLVHRWGESIEIDELRLFYDHKSIRNETAIPEMKSLQQARGGGDKTWDLGESVQVVCRLVDDCIGKGESGADIILVHVPGQKVMFQEVVA